MFRRFQIKLYLFLFFEPLTIREKKLKGIPRQNDDDTDKRSKLKLLCVLEKWQKNKMKEKERGEDGKNWLHIRRPEAMVHQKESYGRHNHCKATDVISKTVNWEAIVYHRIIVHN
jgi:hypothetical protein